MAVPFMLDPPPVVVQTGQTCWAAAFESWQDANARLTGTTSTTGRQQLIEFLDQMDGATFATGRATANGMTLVAGLGLMSLVPFQATYITIERLGVLLQAGYLYITYFRAPRTPAHVVVAYGVDERNIHVMDPWPGRGLIGRPANFFLTMPDGHVVIGLPLAVMLSRAVGQAVESLRPPPVGVPAR